MMHVNAQALNILASFLWGRTTSARRDEHGGWVPGFLEMALHPWTIGKYAVPSQWNRAGQGIILPPASCESYSGYGPKTQCVSSLSYERRIRANSLAKCTQSSWRLAWKIALEIVDDVASKSVAWLHRIWLFPKWICVIVKYRSF